MPYVPSEKTNPPSTDRKVIDAALQPLAERVAAEITNNFSLRKIYGRVFVLIAADLKDILRDPAAKHGWGSSVLEFNLAKAIYEAGAKYGYEGAYLGEFNYAITRFIQLVPQLKVKRGDWQEKDELRYWLYAETVSALRYAENRSESFDIGVEGVFVDIKDEYKHRVNNPYEAAQIVKSGDCYDTPYYTRLVEVVNDPGEHIGYQEIMLKRSDRTLHQDVITGKVVLRGIKW